VTCSSARGEGFSLYERHYNSMPLCEANVQRPAKAAANRAEIGIASPASWREVPSMSKTAALTEREAQHKARAHAYLAETQRILRQLAADRRREERRRPVATSITAEVRAILQGA
jgi:hypothetical protein